MLRRARDRVTEFLARIVFDGQHAVDVAAESQRADHVVRRPDQVIPAQRFEPLVLLACHPGSLVRVRSEPCAIELADDLGAAELFLVRVDLVAPAQPEHAERQLRFAYLQAIAHDVAEEPVERVLTRDVSHIFPVHRSLPHARPQSDSIEQLAEPAPCARPSRHVTFTAPLPDTETYCPLQIRGWTGRRPARRRAALEAGADPVLVTTWINSAIRSRALLGTWSVSRH